jgi:hypothetical protein
MVAVIEDTAIGFDNVRMARDPSLSATPDMLAA